MKILIIGAGNLGLLYYSKLKLLEDPIEISAYVSKRKFSFYKYNNLQYTDITNNIHQLDHLNLAPSLNFWETCKDNELPDICIISTKAYTLPNIVQEYSKLLSKLSTIYLLQNGIGNEEFILKKYPTMKIIRILSSNGAMMIEDGHVKHTGKGFTTLCPYNLKSNTDLQIIENLNRFKLLLEKARLDPSISESPLEAIWNKGFINIGINAFGALTELRNGQLEKVPELRKIIIKTVEEALTIAQMKNIPVSSNEKYISAVFDVIEKTANNKNSMWQDIKNKKKTEIDFINGHIVSIGKKLGLNTPYNEMISVLIKGREYSYKEEKNG